MENKQIYKKLKEDFQRWLTSKPKLNKMPETNLEYLINMQTAFNAGFACGKKNMFKILADFIKLENPL